MRYAIRASGYVYDKCYQSMRSKPQYGTKALGIRMPSGVWLFSNKAATMRGKAKAEPFSV